MCRLKWFGGLGAALLSVLSFAAQGQGGPTFNGTVYYTRYQGVPNVGSVDYTYDQGTKSLTLLNNHNIASVNGADGIILGPNGNLLIGGQNTGLVHEITKTGGFVKDVLTASSPNTVPSFHLSLSQDLKTVYTSPFNGPLSKITLNGSGGLASNGTLQGISGSNSGVTQIVFSGAGTSYYVTGNPNGFGDFGTINLNTGVTSRILQGQQSIHGTQYDPFTGKITFFGAGKVGTYDPATGLFFQSAMINADFDQGSLDGQGHAFIAGDNELTFIDYSLSHDITNPNFVTSLSSANGLSFAFIDDLAPLVGPGSAEPSTVPAPPAVILFALGAVTLVGGRQWRRGKATA